MSLQREDGIVQSIIDTRKAYHGRTDEEFALMYEYRYNVPYKRVLAILLQLKEEVKCK